MPTVLPYNEVLNKLPLASTQFLTPISYDLLNFLIRIGYQRDESFCVSTADLHHGYAGMDMPCLFYNGKPCHHNTIQKHRDLLILFGLISYRTLPRKNSHKHYGQYTLNREIISQWVSYGYTEALATHCLSRLVHSDTQVNPSTRRSVHTMLRDTSRFFRSIIHGLKLSSLERYLFDLVLSLSLSVSSTDLRNVPSKLAKLLPYTPRGSIYRALDEVVSIGCLIGNSPARQCHYIEVPYSIREQAKPRRNIQV